MIVVGQKKKSKVSKIGIALTIMVALFFISIYFSESKIYDEKTAYCESNKYEGYKDEFVLGSEFRCVRKATNGVGYEWEYSGIVNYPFE